LGSAPAEFFVFRKRHGDKHSEGFSLKPFPKGLAEPPSAAVALRRGRNISYGVFLLLAFLLRLFCQKKSGKQFKINLM